MPLLEVRRLTVEFPAAASTAGVPGLSFTLEAGQAVALLGPSGCGKTVAGLALLGLVPPPGRVAGGAALWNGRDLLGLSPPEWRRVRGREIAMVFQEPLAALHPMMTIGQQVREAVPNGEDAPASWLARVGLAEPERMARSYPHQLSGGERQRALLALALAGRPRLLIADEPTSALDGPARRQVLGLLAALRRETGMAMVLITHQVDVARAACDRIVTMGESAGAPARVARAAAPFARGATLLRARDVVREVEGRRLLDGVDFEVAEGECVALVGRSGSGKTTLARVLLRLSAPSGGEVSYRGRSLASLNGKELRRLRRHLQIVFQDPVAALDPRQTVGDAVAEPMRVHRLSGAREAEHRAAALLERVGLGAAIAPRLPHQFSGGQRQRVAIARALASEPELLIADEPVTALDPAARAQILALLSALRSSSSLALILIAHDLAVVEGLADRIVILEGGRVVEEGPAETLLRHPRHAETRRLLGEMV